MIRASLHFFILLSLIPNLVSAEEKKLNFDFYGFLKSSYITASQKIESFGANGIGGITQAAIVDESNSATRKADTTRRFGFQAQQSRFGFKLKHGETLSGKIELDFVDLGAIAPSPDYDVRIRLIMIDWKMSEHLLFQGGQKWVTAVGLFPHTYNYIQANFRSGNTGFISQEMSLKYSRQLWDLTGAISSRGRNQANTGSTENERGILPAFTLRLNFKHKKGIIGTSFVGANLDGESDPSNITNTYQDGNAYIAKAYGSYKNSFFDLRAEYFIGQNTGDLFMLATEGAVFAPSSGTNIHVSGGFLSSKFNIFSKSSIYVGYGMVNTNDGEKYVAANTMIANNVITLGLDRKTDNGLITFVEFQNFDTEYHTGNQVKKKYDAYTIEAGLVYKF